MDEICERDRKRVDRTKKLTSCFDVCVGDGQSLLKVPRKLFMVWNLRPDGERVSKEN